MQIYLSNLTEALSADDLEQLFGHFGPVNRVALVRDRITKKPTGYAVVEMVRAQDAEEAIKVLEGKKLKGQTVRLNRNWPRL